MTDELEKDSGSNGFGWFLVGLGIGAALGVLFAPQAGSETRDSIAEGARERAELIKQKSRAAAVQATEYVDAAKDQVSDYVEQGRQAFDRGRAQVSEYVEEGRKTVLKHADKFTAAIDSAKNAYTATTTSGDGQA